MANHVQAICILVGDDRQLDILLDFETGIDQLAVNPASQRRLAKPGANRGRDFGNSNRVGRTDARNHLAKYSRHSDFSTSKMTEARQCLTSVLCW